MFPVTSRRELYLSPTYSTAPDQDERAALLQIKKTLERKRAATVRKLVFWGLAAAALVGFLVYNANKKTFLLASSLANNDINTDHASTFEFSPVVTVRRTKTYSWDWQGTETGTKCDTAYFKESA